MLAQLPVCKLAQQAAAQTQDSLAMLQDESGQVIEQGPRPASGPGILEQAKEYVGLSPRKGAAPGTTGAAEGPGTGSRGPPATQVRNNAGHHGRLL